MKRLLLSALLLTACSPAQNSGQDYVARLSNVLDVNSPVILEPVPNFPEPRTMRLLETSSQLSIREFLSLRQCKLHTVIARRNSLIGKVASASQVLFNDLQILATGPECLPTVEDLGLKKKLTEYLEYKRATIGVSVWQALLADDENRAFWNTASLQPDYPQQQHAEPIESLQWLSKFTARILADDYDFSKQDFDLVEQHLGRLRFGDGGELLAHYAQLNVALKQGDAMIEMRLLQPLCLNQRATPSALYLQNVVNNTFAPKVQAHAVQLNQRHTQLMTAYYSLERPLMEYAAPAFQLWAKQRDAVFTAGQSATTRHVKLIQQLYLQCGLTAGTRRQEKVQ